MKKPTPAISAVTRVNRLLSAAGYEFRLVRGRGYYFLMDRPDATTSLAAGLPCSSIYAYRIEPEDFEYALGEVNDLLRSGNLRTI